MGDDGRSDGRISFTLQIDKHKSLPALSPPSVVSYLSDDGDGEGGSGDSEGGGGKYGDGDGGIVCRGRLLGQLRTT